jgi:carboxyl-terminal processing protease
LKRTTLHNILPWLAVVWLLSLAGLTAFAQQPQPIKTPAVQSDAARRQEAFETVWQTVNQTFYDPKFGGIDWKSVHERYAPLVAKTSSDSELHVLLQQMINELHQSHFFVIPPQAIPKLSSPGEQDESEAEADADFENDPKSQALTPLEKIRTRLTRRLSTGIGIDLRIIDGTVVITRVSAGSTAARAGLRPGFEIRRVNGAKLSDAIAQIESNTIWHEIIRPELPDFLMANYINGDLTSPVKLLYADAMNREHLISISRQKLNGEMSPAIGNLPPIYTEFEAKRLPGGIGYIRFNAFAPILMKKVCAALRSLHDTRGMIIDLRGNHGGLLGMIAGLTGLLGTTPQFLGSMQTRQGNSPLVAFPQSSPYTGQLVLLIDGTSQSAAEMFAAGLQESGRALVVGEISAGNVIPSAIIKLPTGALLQYGFAKYVTPRGSVLEARGVIPDWIIKATRRTILRGGDPQLTAGLRKLNERIAPPKIVAPPRVVGRVTIVDASPASANPKNAATVVTIAEPPPPPPKPVDAKPIENSATGEKSPSPKEVIEKYIAAVGGEKTLLKMTTRVSVGTVDVSAMGMSGTAELFEQAPNQSAMILTFEGLGTMRNTSDGKSRWLQDPLRGVMRFPSSLPAETDVFHGELGVRKLERLLHFEGHAKVGDRDALVLASRSDGGGSDRLFFDAVTGLLLRRNNSYFEDYREVDGIKLPFITREESPYGLVVLRMTEIKHNVSIGKNRFIEVPDCFTNPNQIGLSQVSGRRAP